MKQLTKEEASRILAPVPYAQQMDAGRMLMPSGIHRERLGSMGEVYCFLTPCSRSLPAVDFTRLADWIEKTLQDRQTAEQVRKVSAASGCYVDTCKATYELLGARIEEAKQVVNSAVSEQGGSDVS